MAKRKFAVLMLASIGALAWINSTRAQDAFPGVGGCAVLAQLVYAEVTADAWYGSGGSGFPTSGPRETRVTVCNDTTRTVTAAFAEAMASMGSEVRWRHASGRRGDFCLSGFLHQCYPERYPPGGANAWGAVSKTVQQAMLTGAASDQSVFSSAAMRLAIRSALAMTDRQRQRVRLDGRGFGRVAQSQPEPGTGCANNW